MTGENERRSRRRTKSLYGSTTVPSAVHYVGYVEDDETPEMIMSKFQELENIQRQASATVGEDVNGAGTCPVVGDEDAGLERGGRETALTDDQLLQVFKQTSMFNVKTALQNNAMLAGIDDMLDMVNGYGPDDIISDDEDMLRSFWSDDDDDWGDSSNKKKKLKGSGLRKSGGTRQRSGSAPKPRHRVVTAYNPSTQALVRRKVKVMDPNEIQYIRIPAAPIPLSWGRTIAPFTPPKTERNRENSAEIICVDKVADISSGMLPESPCEAVLINSKWYKGKSLDEAVERLASLPIQSLVPYGFVFVWTPKELAHKVCKQMQTWGYAYIENLTWVWMLPNNTIFEGQSQYAKKSHLTLYMFRAVDRTQNIELRHQRSPDVVFDYLKPNDRCPIETYSTIEILLPQSRGKLLELWGNKEENDRPGWVVMDILE